MNVQDHIKNLEFPFELEEDRVVENAMILMRVIDMETGQHSFAIATSKGTDEVVAAGLIAVAVDITASGWEDVDES